MAESTVIEVIANYLNCDSAAISAESRLDALGIDSLGAITILYELEERFNIDIPNETIESISNVRDIVNYLKLALGKR
jgi:acyl carrier protein